MVYFCLGMSKHWGTPVHSRLKELCNKHGLMWLRFSMSYHRFSNLRDIFQGDLNRKLMDGVLSCDFMDLPCNCNNAMKRHGKCVYNGNCRKMCVVYKVTCRKCKYFYIGNMQQRMKNHQGQHLDDIKKLVMKGIHSDSFAEHFAHHCEKGIKPSNKDLREMMKFRFIWQGNPISCMKMFGKLDCSLCMRERIKISKAQQLEEAYLINSCYEMFGVCRHKMKFHRFLKEKQGVKSTSTDEGIKPERVDNKMDGKVRVESRKSSRPAHVCNVTPPPGNLTVCSPISRKICMGMT